MKSVKTRYPSMCFFHLRVPAPFFWSTTSQTIWFLQDNTPLIIPYKPNQPPDYCQLTMEGLHHFDHTYPVPHPPRLHWPMEASSRPQNILRLQLKTASKRCRPQRRLSGLSFFADQCQRAGMIITPKWCLPGEVDFSLLQKRMAHKSRLQPQLLENISLIPPLTKGDNYF